MYGQAKRCTFSTCSWAYLHHLTAAQIVLQVLASIMQGLPAEIPCLREWRRHRRVGVACLRKTCHIKLTAQGPHVEAVASLPLDKCPL